MCFKKKAPTESLTSKLVAGKLKIAELDLDVQKSFEAAISALNIKHDLAKELDPKRRQEKELLLQWLIRSQNAYDAKNKIIYLNENKVFAPDCHDDDIIKTYLELIFTRCEPVKEFHLFKSFTGDLVLNLDFTTKKGEEIVYRDKELDIPLSLLAELELRFKITDLYAFLEYLDVTISQINIELLLAKVTPHISTLLRAAVLEAVEKNGICYYDLTKYYADIAASLQENLQKLLANAGIEVSGTHVKNTFIPDGADKIFEEQHILFMQQEKELDLQHKAELMSLENYEKKAEIHSKYPSYELGLTEKEKDNAIDRYLTKQKGYKEENYKAAKKVNIAKREDNLGEITSIQKEKKFNPLPNLFKKEIIIVVIGALLLLSGLASLPTIVGFVLIAGGIVTLGFGISKIINKKAEAKNAETSSTAPMAQKIASPTETTTKSED